MLTWSADMPNPDAESFKIMLADVVQRTQMDKGFVRTRPLAKTAPTALEGTWTLTGPQARDLRNFYRYALHQGSDAFLWPCPVDEGYHVQSVMFTEPPEFTYIDPKEWQASFKFLVQADFGPCYWIELSCDATHQEEVDVAIEVADLTEDFTIDRIEVYTRTVPDSGDTDHVIVGFVGDENELLTSLALTEVGRQIVEVGDGAAGTGIGVLQTAPLTLVVRWESAGTAPTEGDILIIVHKNVEPML